MGMLLRFWAILVVTVKRLISERWLALATALGLIISVALITSIPMYADAIHYRVLLEKLSGEEYGHRPPFAFMYRYVGSWAGVVSWEDIKPLDDYITNRVASDLGLPVNDMVRYFSTDSLRLFPQGDGVYNDPDRALGFVDFSWASDFQDHITVVEGNFPAVADSAYDSAVEVLVSEELSLEWGLQVGEEYTAFVRLETEDDREINVTIPVRIAGIWRATDPTEEYWFYSTSSLAEELFVPEETFLRRIDPEMEQGVDLGLWYLLADGSEVYADDVNNLLSRIIATRQRTSAILPGAGLDVSPEDDLQAYRRSTTVLTFLLYAFSVPIVGLLLVFIGLVVGLSVGQKRNEIAVLRSRGATSLQIIGISILEGVLMGIVSVAIGLVVGRWLALLIGRSRSFLDFSLPGQLRAGVTLATVRFGVAAIVLALFAQLGPTLSAARHTVVTYKQERARTLRKPWWQRAWLDVLLLIPTVYGFYVLDQQQGVVTAVAGERAAADPFQNPLLLLVPALGIFALALFILRILPTVMTAVAWVASRLTNTVGLLLAARHLSRTPGFYVAPLILLILTLSLSAFTASLAQTLDTQLYAQTYYQVGSSLRLAEQGDCLHYTASIPPECDLTVPPPHWSFLPVAEHLNVEGVTAASRVGDFNAVTNLSGGIQIGTFLGIDRESFVQVAFWRDDFASQSLGELMNQLALTQNGVLIPSEFAAQHALNVGDFFRLEVRGIKGVEMDVQVVGKFDMFPTWYPDDGPLFVGNLDYFFEQAGERLNYDVWLATEPDADYEQIELAVRDLGVNVISREAPLPEIYEEQRRPERQGLFGVLSVGFLASAVLTVLGFLLYAFFSFRRRFIELGVLRAIGLSAAQMTVFLAWELAFLLLVGAVAGTGLGAWVSHLFIPYLQSGTGVEAQFPPFVVAIDWIAIFRIYALFGALFVAALAGLAALLMRIKIFQAVKLGETA
ncbi:MAG: FtsX-like permease family protein [Anaerolineae bacterium]|nr:FtsX-like permease family protein [Anaerolineae bacterium]